MDKQRILQMVLTLAVIGSLALVAGSIVTNQSSEWGPEVTARRGASPLGQQELPAAPNDSGLPAPPVVPPAMP